MIARGDRIDEGGLAAATTRLRKNLEDRDAEVSQELANEGERADLWTEIEVNIEDLRTVLAAASHADAAPVAWSFELANYINEDGSYTGWDRTPKLSFNKPCVPEGSIRNLTPLYAAPATPPAAGSVTEEMVETRNDEAGFVEFVNADVPYFVREIDGRVAVIFDMQTRNVIGYRVYDPASAAPVPPVVGEDARGDDGRQLAHRLADIARSLLERPPELRGPFKADEEALRRVAALPPATTKTKTDVRAALASSVPAAPSQPVQVKVKEMEGLLIACAGILDMVKIEWEKSGDWSSYDQSIRDGITAALSSIEAAPGWRSKALDDVAAERRRQVEAEGWTTEHDDAHTDESLARAAVCYAEPNPELVTPGWPGGEKPRPVSWPRSWSARWWKPVGDRRRNLIKAGALILAEIERLDRLPSAPAGGKDNG